MNCKTLFLFERKISFGLRCKIRFELEAMSADVILVYFFVFIILRWGFGYFYFVLEFGFVP